MREKEKGAKNLARQSTTLMEKEILPHQKIPVVSLVDAFLGGERMYFKRS